MFTKSVFTKNLASTITHTCTIAHLYVTKILPLLLTIILFVLIFLLRLNQVGGMEAEKPEFELEIFKTLREDLDQRITTLLPSPQAELLSGIVLGNKKDLPAQFRLALRDTSTLHIVVVSGQNLTLLAGMILALSGLLKRRTAIILSLGAILFYTLLTGAQIPVLRAAVMASLSFLAMYFGRQKEGVSVLFITAGTLLLISPNWITDLSFQLSFLATMGVLVVAPILEKGLLKQFPEFIRQDLSITIGAQALVIPIIAQNFHQISLVSVLANLLIGWTVPFIMLLGTIMIFSSLIFLPLAQLFALLTNIFLTYFIYIVKFFASLPFAWEYVGEKSYIFWAGYYLLLTGVILSLNQRLKTEKIDKEARSAII